MGITPGSVSVPVSVLAPSAVSVSVVAHVLVLLALASWRLGL